MAASASTSATTPVNTNEITEEDASELQFPKEILAPMFVPSKDHIRNVLLYEFHKGVNASVAAKSIQSIYGEDVVNERSCRRWFSRFRSGDFNLKDELKNGRPKKLDSDLLEALVSKNPAVTTREIAEQLNVAHTTVVRQLKHIGKVSVAGKWVPHKMR